jgi:hypothetical protein
MAGEREMAGDSPAKLLTPDAAGCARRIARLEHRLTHPAKTPPAVGYVEGQKNETRGTAPLPAAPLKHPQEEEDTEVEEEQEEEVIYIYIRVI